MLGRSGSTPRRVAAIAVSAPDWMCGSTVGAGENITEMRPASRSVSDCALPG